MAWKIRRWVAELAREKIGDEKVGAVDLGDRDDFAQRFGKHFAGIEQFAGIHDRVPQNGMKEAAFAVISRRRRALDSRRKFTSRYWIPVSTNPSFGVVS